MHPLPFLILTLNVWDAWRGSLDRLSRLEGLAGVLARGEPAADIVVLQEAWTKDGWERLSLPLNATYPHQLALHSAGLAVLSKFPLLEALHTPYLVNGRIERMYSDGFESLGAKGALLVRVELAPGRGLDVYTTHLVAQASPADDAYLTQRLLQVLQLKDFIRRTRRRGNGLVLAGDLNAVPHDLIHRLLFTPDERLDGRQPRNVTSTTLLLADAWAETHTGLPLGTSDSATFGRLDNQYSGLAAPDQQTLGPIQRLDYVIFDPLSGVQATSCQPALTGSVNALGMHVSDHAAVLANLTLTGSPATVATSKLPLPRHRAMQHLQRIKLPFLLDHFASNRDALQVLMCFTLFVPMLPSLIAFVLLAPLFGMLVVAVMVLVLAPINLGLFTELGHLDRAVRYLRGELDEPLGPIYLLNVEAQSSLMGHAYQSGAAAGIRSASAVPCLVSHNAATMLGQNVVSSDAGAEAKGKPQDPKPVAFVPHVPHATAPQASALPAPDKVPLRMQPGASSTSFGANACLFLIVSTFIFL